MLDENIVDIYNKNKIEFINSYIFEIKRRYINFKKFNELEKYQEALKIWENFMGCTHFPNDKKIISMIRDTEDIAHIYPDMILKIDGNKKIINKITSKLSHKKMQYWMTTDPESYPATPDQKTISAINVFWFLVGRPVNFDLEIYRRAFSNLWKKSQEICNLQWDDEYLYIEISHMTKNQFGDFLVANKDYFTEILTLREIYFSNRFNRS